MPNWVTNLFTIFGDTIILKEIESIKFDFQKIKPAPEKIHHVLETRRKLSNRRDANIKWGKPGEGGTIINRTEEDEVERLEKKWKEAFDDNNIWYDKNWNGEYWAHDLDIKWVNNNTLKVFFLTRWTPAVEIMKQLTETYPVKIKLHAWEHQNFDIWDIIYEKGKTISFKHDVDTSIWDPPGEINDPIQEDMLEKMK